MNWLLPTAMFIMIYTFAGYCLQKNCARKKPWFVLLLLLTDGAQETATARWWGAAHSCRPHAEDGCGYSGHQASDPSLVFVSLMIAGDQCEVLDSGHWSEQVFLNLDGVKNCSLLGRVALQHGAADVGRWCGCGVPVPAELSALL